MKYIVIFLGMLIIPMSASAIDKAAFEKKIGVKIKTMSPSPINGIYEMVTNENQIFYTDDSGKFVLSGNIIDLSSRVNITQQRIDFLNKVDFKTLPLQDAIKVGTGKKKLAVFHDPDCPFCRKLYVELKKIKDVEVYNFIFFLAELHPAAYEKAKKVYCADDPLEALDMAMTGKDLKGIKVCDTDVVDKNAKLANKVGVRGTPHMILEDGTSIRGFRSLEYIQNKIAGISIN